MLKKKKKKIHIGNLYCAVKTILCSHLKIELGSNNNSSYNY